MTEIYPIPYQPIKGQSFNGKYTVHLKAKDFNVPKREGTSTIFFDECVFDDLLLVIDEGLNFQDLIVQFHCCFIKRFEVSKVGVNDLSLDFGGCILSGRSMNPNIKYLRLNNCVLYSDFFIKDVENISISFTEGNIFPTRWKKLLAKTGSAYSIFQSKQRYYVYNPVSFEILMSKINNDSGPGFYIDEFQPLNADTRLGYKFTKQMVEKSDVSLRLQYEKEVGGRKIDIKNMELEALEIIGKISAEVNVENLKVNRLYLDSLDIKNDASFYNISKRTQNLGESRLIEIKRSILDNVIFDNFAFDQYDTVSFYRSKISKTAFLSCSFPKSLKNFTVLENIHYKDARPENFQKDLYELVLQLKRCVDATGNYHESQKLQAVSNDALRLIESTPWWDKKILSINKFSNDHGLSIARPLIIFFSGTVLTYIFYLMSLQRIFSPTEVDYSLIGYYFAFIDITHRSDFLMDKEHLNGLSIAIDSLNKIFVGFIIYQFVAAFRKYGKKL